MPTFGSSRRAFIKTMGVVAAATCGRAAAAKAQDYKPQDQKKLTQAAARYQDHPKGNEICASCPYFVVPNELRSGRGRDQPDRLVPHLYDVFSTRSRCAYLMSVSTLIRAHLNVP